MPDDQTQGPGTSRRWGLNAARVPGVAVPAGRSPSRVVAVMAGISMLTATASASDWKFQAFGSATVTLSNNINLAPSGEAENGAAVRVTPGISASREGARLKVNINYAPTAVWYTQGTNSNTWYNTLSATGSLEAVENFFFIDARASISQQFLSPFGPTPTDLAVPTANRSNVTSLGVSPWIRGVFGGTGITYFARNDSSWTDASGSGGGNGYSNFTVARITGAPARVAWGLEYDRRNTNYQNQSGFINENYRARLTWTIDPQFSVYGVGGYQNNNFSTTQRSGPIYGGGFNWRPSERTTVAAGYEEQFYGPSWFGNATYRTPRSYWSLVGTRQLSSYPQEALLLPPGDTAATLNNVLLPRFPDPAARQAEVQRLITTLGLPGFLVAPQSFYTQNLFVNERISLTAGLIGLRNTVTFVVFTGYSETIPATSNVAVQGAFASASRINQQGASGIWSHRLTPLTNLNFLASRTESDAQQPTGAKSTTDQFNLTLTRPLGPKTNGSVGLRYTIFDTNVGNDYREAAVLATVSHTF
jgi:uncharacterized protein (PEP-CTERM system associated)